MANFIERYRMKRKVKENMTKKKTPVQGTMKGKPIDTTGGPSYMKKTTKPSASTMDGNAYTPTQLKPVGPDMGRDARKSRSDGQSVPGKKAITKTRTGPGRVTERQEGYTLNYRDGPNYKSKKKQTTKDKDKNKKKSRGLVTMTSMQNKYL